MARAGNRPPPAAGSGWDSIALRLRAAVAAALLAPTVALTAAAPAAASVRYAFLTEAGSFTVRARDYIILPTEIAPAELESCAPSEACPGSTFLPERARDTIEFSPDGKQTRYLFRREAFTTPGRHDTIEDSPQAVLIVTIVADEEGVSLTQIVTEASIGRAGDSGSADVPAVPEPGTWLMMVSGFGLIGTAVRRGHKGSPRKS